MPGHCRSGLCQRDSCVVCSSIRFLHFSALAGPGCWVEVLHGNTIFNAHADIVVRRFIVVQRVPKIQAQFPAWPVPSIVALVDGYIGLRCSMRRQQGRWC